jgi:hypothetical protein
MPTLTWEELAGDLRLARQFCDQILIHSLEGCVWQGFLPRLRSFEWADVEGPPDGVRAAAALRTSLRATLWASSHPAPVLGITAAAACLLPGLSVQFAGGPDAERRQQPGRFSACRCRVQVALAGGAWRQRVVTVYLRRPVHRGDRQRDCSLLPAHPDA